MKIKTDRLFFRPWEEEDAEELYKYAKDLRVGPIAGWPVHESVENSRMIIRDVLSAPQTYAIIWKDTNLPVGCIDLKFGEATNLTDKEDECEMGYWIGVPYWGQGIMPEAAEAMLRHAFENLRVKKVWCGYYDGNDKSKRVQEKCGFQYQWTTENVEVPLMHETRVEHVTCLTVEQWRQRKSGEYCQ